MAYGADDGWFESTDGRSYNRNEIPMATFNLVRHFRDGTDAPIIDRITAAKVRMYVSQSLCDNVGTSRADAHLFAVSVLAAERDTRVTHASGLAYPVTRGGV